MRWPRYRDELDRGCECAPLTLATCAVNCPGFHLPLPHSGANVEPSKRTLLPLVERQCLRYNLRAMNLNRPLQLRMLQALKEFYPAHNPHFTQQFESDPDFISNLHYLKGHCLLTGSASHSDGKT